MDEYISREAVYQVLCEIARGLSVGETEALKTKDLKAVYKIQGAKEILSSVDNDLCLIPSVDVQSTNPWISVKDKLPETNTIGIAHILAYDRYEGVVKADFLDKSANYVNGSNIFQISNTSTQLYKVTHWMPLPEPPENGDTKQKSCINCKWYTVLKNHLKEDMPVCRHEVAINHGTELKVSCCVYYEPKER